ncbi:hypothetical protein FOA52_013602 [Chlamydomonas sp. UWO 241]|nr:hypothetical protein FOA52_013602 [Chlamydomonas sp. UWO 241]
MNPHSVHAVLFSEDLLVELWPWLDAPTKAALRGVCSAMRRQVDGSIVGVASPGYGFTAADLTAALRNWHGVTGLTLHVFNDNNLEPLATASLTRLTSLTLREFRAGAWGTHALNVNLAAMLQVIDISHCTGLESIDALGSCAQLRLRVIDISYCYGIISINTMGSCAQLKCLWMAAVSVRDLAPLAACSQLEELWMADNYLVNSLAPLKACPVLRKLDLCGCRPMLRAQAHGHARPL